MPIITNGDDGVVSAAMANKKDVGHIFARNGDGEWCHVWPYEKIRWFRSFTEFVEFDNEIKGSMSNIDVYVGIDTTQQWESYGNMRYGRMVYGTDYTDVPTIMFGITYNVPPPSPYTTYGFYVPLSPFLSCDGSGEILVPRDKGNTLGGSTILYGSSTRITIDGNGNPTLNVKGMTYFDWPGNNVLPHESGFYTRYVENNIGPSMWYGEDYRPKLIRG